MGNPLLNGPPTLGNYATDLWGHPEVNQDPLVNRPLGRTPSLAMIHMEAGKLGGTLVIISPRHGRAGG